MAFPKHRFAVSFRASDEIRNRLRLGSSVRAVVLERLGHDTALVSVRGLSTVAVSPLPLFRGQVLYAEVADIGEKVHLRIVPPPQIGEASHMTTAAELARHLASLGIEPADTAICVAAAMLSAGLSITVEHFARVSDLVAASESKEYAMAAAAAYIVRHGLPGDPDTAESVRAALFEPPCLGELLAAIEAALSSRTPAPAGQFAPAGEALRAAVRTLLESVRSGGPSEWLAAAVELCAPPTSPTGESVRDWPMLLGECASACDGDPGELGARVRTLVSGLRMVTEVGAAQPAQRRWTLQVPFARNDTLATAFVELSGARALTALLPALRDCEVRAWVPLAGDAVASCELSVRESIARGTLRVTGAHEPDSVAAAAEKWIAQELRRAGFELSRLAHECCDDPSADPLPTVGLDFEV